MNRRAQRGGGVGLGVGGFALGAAFTYLLDHPGASPRFDQVKQKAEGAVREIAQQSRAVLFRSEGPNPTPSFPGSRALAGVAGLGLLTWAAVIRNSVRAGIGLAAVSLLWRSLTNQPTGRFTKTATAS